MSSGNIWAPAGVFFRKLLDFNGIELHASAVVVDGYAYLFSAPPGTGKSTHTALWLELFGEKAFILNDDKPVMRYIDGAWYAYGAPWSGSVNMSVNTRVSLGGICILERGEENEITPVSAEEAFPFLLSQTQWRDKRLRAQAIEMLAKLTQGVPLWRLKCTISREAAVLSHAAMSAQAGKKYG